MEIPSRSSSSSQRGSLFVVSSRLNISNCLEMASTCFFVGLWSRDALLFLLRLFIISRKKNQQKNPQRQQQQHICDPRFVFFVYSDTHFSFSTQCLSICRYVVFVYTCIPCEMKRGNQREKEEKSYPDIYFSFSSLFCSDIFFPSSSSSCSLLLPVRSD